MDLINIITTIVTVASIIAALKPIPNNNKWIEKFYKLTDLLAINVGKAKQ
jgi:hypothetical protein